MTLDANWGMFTLHPVPGAPMDRPLRIYLLLLSGTLAWCAAIVAAPLLRSSGGVASVAASVLYQFFQPVCHQIESRSLHLFGAQLAVCMRCSAIYGGFLAGTILYPAIRSLRAPAMPSRRWLIGASLPMLIDVAAGILGLHAITPLTRTITGFLAGAALPFFVIPAVIEAFGGSLRFSTRPEPIRKEL